MSPRMRLTNFICVLILATTACRSDSGNNGGPDGPTGSGADAPIVGGTSVKALLTASPAPVFPQAVEVDGVVIVAKKKSTATVAEFWVQDPGGGPSSGIHIYCNTTAKSNACATPIATIDALNIGDVINVAGKFDNNNFQGHPDDFEIIQPAITKQNKTMTPAAMVVDAASLGKDQTTGATFDTLANTLVKVNGPVTVSNLMGAQYGTTSCYFPADAGVGAPDAGPKVDAGPAAYIFGFEATVGSTTIAVGLRYVGVTACMPDCDVCGMNNECSGCTADKHVTMGETFSSIQGIAYGNYQQSMPFLEIQPVSDADLKK
jgi:hypothetical protein